MKKREIPKKNYIVSLIIAFVTLILTFKMAAYYKDKRDYEDKMNAVINFLSEVKVDELDTFITEKHDLMIYIANSEVNNDNIQKKVKRIITKNNYESDIAYLNMKDLDEQFYEAFSSKYFENIGNTSIVSDSLIIIKDGKVRSIININEKNVSNLKNNIDNIFYGEE